MLALLLVMLLFCVVCVTYEPLAQLEREEARQHEIEAGLPWFPPDSAHLHFYIPLWDGCTVEKCKCGAIISTWLL